MKNIAMRCNQSQFDAIKPILEYNNKKILKVTDFDRFPYLVNVEGVIFNTKYPRAKWRCDRSCEGNIYEEWNPFLFLEFCGIKNVGWSIKVTIDNVDLLVKYFKTAQINFDSAVNSNHEFLNYENNNIWFSFFPHLYFLQIDTETFKKHIMNNNQENNKTITIQQLLEIYQVACHQWRLILTNQYFPKVDKNGQILITNEQIKTMFKASDSNQIKVLESIFGKPQEIIEFDKLKTGSIIRLQKIPLITADYTQPFYIVFRNNGYGINSKGVFIENELRTAFMQNGIFYNIVSTYVDKHIIKVEEY